MSAVTRRSASIRSFSASVSASTARASSSVSSRTTPPTASPTRTSVCPWATRPAAAAALRSRRESRPPMSTPSAQPPKTTETEPMISARSRSSMIVAERSANRVCSERTSPLASGRAAQTSGTPSAPCSTWVARRFARTSSRRDGGSVGSLSCAPNFGPPFCMLVAS